MPPVSSNVWSTSGDVPYALRSRSVDLSNYKASSRNVWGADDAFLSPPDLTGPLQASLDSEESSEDCEDYISGLAEEIAQSMLREDDVARADEETFESNPWPKPAWGSRKMSSSPTSPQSTLAGFNWESQSNRGSSGVTSPPTPQEEGEAVDVLYSELLRKKLDDEVKSANQQRQMLSLQQQIIRRPSACSVSGDSKQSLASHHVSRSSSTAQKSSHRDHHSGRENVLSLAIDKAMMVRQGRHQLSKGRSSEAEAMGGGSWVAGRGRKGAGGSGKRVGGGDEQLGKSGGDGRGLRAFFLGVPTPRQSGGTGVFLPRRIGSPQYHAPSRRQPPACSTVLLPPHIVQALNLNVKDTRVSPHRRDTFSSGRHHHCTIPAVGYRPDVKEEGSTRPITGAHPTTLLQIAPNISLPSEWTY